MAAPLRYNLCNQNLQPIAKSIFPVTKVSFQTLTSLSANCAKETKGSFLRQFWNFAVVLGLIAFIWTIGLVVTEFFLRYFVAASRTLPKIGVVGEY